jgi:hypothetical protein
MKKQTTITGIVLILAAITFWLSWFLMPDPGTTDSAHILQIVKRVRESVFTSAITQIISSVLYVIALTLLAQLFLPQRKLTTVAIIFFGIGVLGMCSDAFFHLLAYYMTDSSVDIQPNVVRVMEFMQTDGVIILIPILLPFFIGSLLLAMGLRKQDAISAIPVWAFSLALTVGPVVAIIARKAFLYQGNIVSLCILGLFAIGQAIIGYEIIKKSSHA